MSLTTLRNLICSLIFLPIAGCVTTQEMPLAPNMVRIDTDAHGALFTRQAVPSTMRSAAQATLSNGFTRFRLADASVGQGTEPVGTLTTTNGNFGSTSSGPFVAGSFSTFSSGDVIERRTAHSGATVIMFHDGEPGSENSFDAAQVLKQYGG